MWLAIFCLLLGAIFLLFFVMSVGYILIDYSARKEVKIAPRKPMAECQKHGMFLKELMFELEIPPAIQGSGLPLKIEQCPFCFDERMKNSENVLKSLKEGKTVV